jgi:predicted permease
MKKLSLYAGAVLSLGLALGAALVVLSAVDALIWKPLPYPDQDRILRINREQGPERIGPPVSAPAFRDLFEQQQSLESFAAFTTDSLIVTGAERAEQVLGAVVGGDYFAIFGLPMSQGRALGAADERADAPAVVAISYAHWRDAFASRPVLGERITIDGMPHTIVGVTNEAMRLPNGAALVRPLRVDDDSARGNNYLLLIGKLKSGTSLAERFPDNHAQLDFSVRRLKDTLTERWEGPFKLLMAAIALLLLIGAASFINLLLADHAARQREFATRLALGSSAARMARMALKESVVLVGLATAAGFGLALLAMPQLPQWLLGTRELTLWTTPAVVVLVVAAVLAVASAGIVGAATWRAVARQSLASAGRGTSLHKRAHRLRRALVVAQISFSLVLLCGAGLMTESMRRLLSEDLGFSMDNLIAMRIVLPAETLAPLETPADMYPSAGRAGQLLLTLERDLAAQPGFDKVGIISRAPIIDGAGVNTGFNIEGEPSAPEGSAPLVEFRFATPGYFDALGQTLIDGQAHGDSPVPLAERRTLVNAALAERYLAHREPVGSVILNGSLRLPIQGVVKSARQNGFDEPARPELYVSYLDFPSDSNATIVVRSALPLADILERTRSVAARLHPGMPVYDVQHFAEAASGWTQRREFLRSLMQFFSLTALAIALVGLYALFAHAVAQRSVEFGIHQALGAAPATVLAKVFKEGLTVAAIGIGAGLAISMLLAPVYESQIYAMSATDPAVHLTAALLLLAAAAFSVLLPAWRAHRTPAQVALRAE